MGTRRQFGWGLAASVFSLKQGSLTLKAQAPRGLRVGMAVDAPRLFHDPAYAGTVAEQASVITPENAMKWAALRPAPGQFDFAEADKLMRWAEARGIAVRGHTLCWHRALPGWFDGFVTKGNAERVLREHVATVVGRYRGRIRCWDVVNEAVELKDGRVDGLRDSPWLRLLGPGYVRIAFEAAREADPHVPLYYNEYGLELDGAKRAAVLRLLHGLGKRVDGLGLQSHLSADSASNIGEPFAAWLRQLGLKTAVTELDVNDDSISADDLIARSRAVAEMYSRYARLLLGTAAVMDVVCWGVNNGSSWLNAKEAAKLRPRHPDREQLSLLFDDSYQPQPAFWALRDALHTGK